MFKDDKSLDTVSASFKTSFASGDDRDWFTGFAVGVPVAWLQPADLTYAEDQPLPELGGIFRGGSPFSGLAKEDGFNAALADGSLRWIKRLPSEEAKSQFRSLIPRKGNKTESELLQ